MAPLAIQEMVFALWLINRGLNPSTLTADPVPSAVKIA